MPTDRLHLVMPARACFLGPLRGATATAAAEWGCSHERLDDVRLAIGELAAAVVGAARADSTLHVEVEVGSQGLTAHGWALASEQDATLTELARLLLATVAPQHHRVGCRGDAVLFDLVMDLGVRPSAP